MNKLFTLSAITLFSISMANAASYISNGFFEQNVDGWAMWNGGDDGASFERESGTQFDGVGCMKVVNPISDPENQWKVQIHTSFEVDGDGLPAGEYELSYYIRTQSGTGSVRVSTSGEETYQADQEVTATYSQKTHTFTSKGEVDGFNFDIAHTANTYFIDNVTLKALSVEQQDPDNGEYTKASVGMDINDKQQEVLGIGGGIVYYQSWFTDHPNKEAIFDTIYTGLGLSALRIGNWKQDIDNHDVKDELTIYNEAVKRLGRENFIVEMSSWAAPGSLKENGQTDGPYSLKKGSDGNFVYNEYAEWWKKSLAKYQEEGIHPDYISMQNEPDMEATYAATLFDATEHYVDYTGKQFDRAGYDKALPIFVSKIKELNEVPKILGPEVLGIGYGNTQKYMDALDASLLDGLAFHYYHSGENADDRYSKPNAYINAMKELATKYGNMPQFMTENCAMRAEKSGNDVHTAWIIANSFNYNHVGSYMYWNLLWGTSDKDGCVAVNNPWEKGQWKSDEGYQVCLDYHGLRHFSKFAPKGYFCVGSTTDNSDLVCTSFVSPDGNKATIVVINKGGNHAVKVNVPFTNCTARLTMTATSKDERSKDYGVIDLANEIEMPKMSIATITFENNGSLDDVKQYTADETFIATFANDNLQIITSEAANANVEVWDVTGKVWMKDSVSLNAGVNTVETNIPSGVYFVKVTANGKQSVVKCVK